MAQCNILSLSVTEGFCWCGHAWSWCHPAFRIWVFQDSQRPKTGFWYIRGSFLFRHAGSNETIENALYLVVLRKMHFPKILLLMTRSIDIYFCQQKYITEHMAIYLYSGWHWSYFFLQGNKCRDCYNSLLDVNTSCINYNLQGYLWSISKLWYSGLVTVSPLGIVILSTFVLLYCFLFNLFIYINIIIIIIIFKVFGFYIRYSINSNSKFLSIK